MGVVRTLVTDPYVKMGLRTIKMESRMNISLEELSKILAAVGISSSQGEQILTVIKNLSTSPEVKEELEEEPETSTNHLCQYVEEPKNSREQSFELDIKEAKEENTSSDLHEEGNQEYHNPIERWFQTIIRSHRSFILPYFFVSSYLQQLVSYTLVFFKVYFSNLSVNVFLILLRMWLHWKYVYKAIFLFPNKVEQNRINE